MEIKDIQRKGSEPRKLTMTIRITESYSNFMREQNISPTAMFNEAIQELKKKAK